MIADQFAEIARQHAHLFGAQTAAEQEIATPAQSPSCVYPRDQFAQIMSDEELADALAA